ncbi:MAG: PorV/PorQ family protein [Fidelibacterota bacterium]
MKRFIVILTVIALTGSAGAQGFTKVGTSAAQFLKFPVDARTAALAGTHSGIYGDVASLYWNPAGIAAVDRLSVAFSYLNLYVGIQHSFMGIVAKVGRNSAVGVSAIVLDSGEIEQTTVARPEGTGALFRVRNYAFGLSYARYMTEWVMLGATVKYVQEDLWNETATGVAVDIGSVLETGILGVKLGMNISNFGTDLRLEGEDLRFHLDVKDPSDPDVVKYTIPRGGELKTEPWPMPWRFQAGLAIDLVGGSSRLVESDIHRVTFLGQYDELNDAGARGNFGVEYQWNNTLSGRIGNYSNADSPRFSAGLGLSFRLAGRRFDLDYALVDYGRLDAVHHTTLGITF